MIATFFCFETVNQLIITTLLNLSLIGLTRILVILYRSYLIISLNILFIFIVQWKIFTHGGSIIVLCLLRTVIYWVLLIMNILIFSDQATESSCYLLAFIVWII